MGPDIAYTNNHIELFISDLHWYHGETEINFQATCGIQKRVSDKTGEK